MNEVDTDKAEIDSIDELVRANGPMIPGTGMVSGVIALVLAVLSVLAVVAFHFPEYLTTPELRAKYDVGTLRVVLGTSMVLAALIALVNFIRGKRRFLAVWTFALVTVAQFLGGPSVPVGSFPDGTPYLGLDWLVLDLLGSAVIFIFVEKLFALRKDQPIFRSQWQNDAMHFAVNHLLVGFMLILVNQAIYAVQGVASHDGIRHWFNTVPFVPALLLATLIADFAQYWTHRAYHEIPFLWRFHAVHHSAPVMDWIAGSRQHLLEIFVTRVLVLAPLYVLGFSLEVLDAYVVVVGFQAVFNHANVSVRLGPLSGILVTPNFHHWHHSQDNEAIDKNYAAHFAFIDRLFGTAVVADRKWPDRYGVVGDYIPVGFLKQQAFPFRGAADDSNRAPDVLGKGTPHRQ